MQSLYGLAVRGVSLHVAKTLGVRLCDKEESSATLMRQQM
jgi:hypothetical protein